MIAPLSLMRRRGGGLLAAIVVSAMMAAPGQAQDADPAPDLSARFVLDGERLIFDTVALLDGEEVGIRFADADTLREMLRRHDEIAVLELNSEGGGVFSAMRLAELVIDFELDTDVRNICESSCVTILLGGTKRTMARGARIGFHQFSWSVEAMTEYYEDSREDEGWETPFEFASWVYTDTQTETYNRLQYLIARGVDPTFAIQTLRRPDGSMWRPYRAVLLAAGVLTQ